jgi:hypothetical protein
MHPFAVGKGVAIFKIATLWNFRIVVHQVGLVVVLANIIWPI